MTRPPSRGWCFNPTHCFLKPEKAGRTDKRGGEEEKRKGGWGEGRSAGSTAISGECPATTLVSTRDHLLQEARTLVASSNNSSCPALGVFCYSPLIPVSTFPRATLLLDNPISKMQTLRLEKVTLVHDAQLDHPSSQAPPLKTPPTFCP